MSAIAATVVPPATTRARQPRMVFIDVARSAAILGAIAAHTVAVFGVWPAVPPGLLKAIGNGVFYTCTPTFFLLFGVMLELVYVRRAERDGGPDTARRLAIRAGQCWLGLVLGMACAWISGRILSAQLPDALLSLIDTPNSGILRFYTAAMLLCIPVVLLRPRFGPALPLALAATVWVGAAFLPLLPWPEAGSRWGFLCGFLVAHPPVWTSGSLWHNLGVVFLGMALGHHMRQRLVAGLPPLGGTPVAILVGFCLVGTAVCAVRLGPLALAHGYFGTGRIFRSAAHPGYFFISTLSALALIWLAQRIWPASTDPARVRLPLLALGRHSLLVFAVGNAGLNLFPPEHGLGFAAGVAATILYLAAVCLLAILVDRRTQPAAGAA